MLVTVQFRVFVFVLAVLECKAYNIPSIILPMVLYGSVTLGEEHRLRVFENRELKRIFGPTRDEITGK
jgi:hypothetical protein